MPHMRKFTASPRNVDVKLVTEADVVSASVDLSFDFPTGVLFDGFQLRIRKGTLTCLVGASGTGKTVLLDALAGTDAKLSLCGSAEKRPPIACAYRDPQLFPWFDIRTNAAIEAYLRTGDISQSLARAEAMIALLRLSTDNPLPVHLYSSGMAQRLELARALATSPTLLLLDEPLSAVDQPTRVQAAQNVACHIRREQTTALWITHDITEATAVADRVVVIGGRPVRILLDREISRKTIEREALEFTQTAAIEKEIFDAVVSSEQPDLASYAEVATNRSGVISYRTMFIFFPGIAVFFLWAFVAALWPQSRFFISSPSLWYSALISTLQDGSLVSDTSATVARAGFGMLIAVVVGVPLGIAFGSRPGLSRIVRPWLVAITAIPLFVFGPAFVLWFGVGFNMHIAVSSATALPLLTLTIMDAVNVLRTKHLRSLLNTGTDFWRVLRHILVPGVLWYSAKGLRLSLLAALLGAFVGELIASDAGLGHAMMLNAGRYRMDLVSVQATMFFSIALACDGVLAILFPKIARLLASCPKKS